MRRCSFAGTSEGETHFSLNSSTDAALDTTSWKCLPVDVFTTRVMSTPGLAVVIVAIVFTLRDGVRLFFFVWRTESLIA